jgi:L-rhamnonate dehydratase
MKIKEIRAFEIDVTPKPSTAPRKASRAQRIRMNRPLSRYPQVAARGRAAQLASGARPACKVIAQDGTWGLGISLYPGPVISLIRDLYAPHLVGENCMATEKLWDVMVRLSPAFGASGLASYAISAVDCALWDLKGKLLGRPVYELLGGPQKERIFGTVPPAVVWVGYLWIRH